MKLRGNHAAFPTYLWWRPHPRRWMAPAYWQWSPMPRRQNPASSHSSTARFLGSDCQLAGTIFRVEIEGISPEMMVLWCRHLHKLVEFPQTTSRIWWENLRRFHPRFPFNFWGFPVFIFTKPIPWPRWQCYRDPSPDQGLGLKMIN